MKKLLTRNVARPWALTALAVVVVFAGLSLWPQGVSAANPIDLVKDPATFISNILISIVGLLGKLLVQLINIMIAVAKYNHFSSAPAIQRGWVILRDLGNIFFIIVLMVIAFATILKIESYRYNRLLGRLIIMAVLVNFSRMIAGLFIDFTQVIMLTFVSAFKDAAAGNLAQGLGLTELLNLQAQGTGQVTSGEIMTALILANVMLIIAIVVVGIVALVLVMRILALWLLVVLSPIAYIARTFPLTERYSRIWWSNFGKYATSGPIMAFFLWLTFTIVSTGNSTTPSPSQYGFESPDTAEINQNASTGGLPNSISSTISAVSDSDSILSFIIAISLLIGSLTVTSQLGVAGGRFAGAASERVRRLAGRGAVLLGAAGVAGVPGVAAALFGRQAARGVAATAKFVPGYAERKLYGSTGIGLSPTRIKEGMKEAFADRRRKDELAGSGRAGEAMQKGGVSGFLKGFSGASRDWTDVYTRGFLANKGIKRAYQTITGGQAAVENIQHDIDEEQQRNDQLKELAKVFTKSENDNMRTDLGRANTEVGALNSFVSGDRPLDTSALSVATKLQVAGLITDKVLDFKSQIKNLGEQLKVEKNESKRGVLRKQIEDKRSQSEGLERRFGNVILAAEKRRLAEENLTRAREAGDVEGAEKEQKNIDVQTANMLKALPTEVDLQPNWEFNDNWRNQLRTTQEKMQKKVVDLKQNIEMPIVTLAEKQGRQADLNRSNARIEDLKLQQQKAMGPEAFYALRDRRALIREEMRKIETTNEDELIHMFNNAVQNGDKINAAAILMQAARAGHLNEIVNASRYQKARKFTDEEKKHGWEDRAEGEKFSSNQQGLSDFFNQIMGEKLGMNKDERLTLQSDASDIAQENDHWAMAQSIGMHNGELYQHSPNEQAARVITEMSKKDQEGLARRGNRLMYGGEVIDPKTGDRIHHLEPFGVSLLKGSWPTIYGEITKRGRYNQNAAKNLTNTYNMKILKELANSLDNTKKTQNWYDGQKDAMTQREAFEQFIETLKQYSDRKAPRTTEEAAFGQEIVRRGKESEA